jgi:Transglycosylase SLT domain
MNRRHFLRQGAAIGLSLTAGIANAGTHQSTRHERTFPPIPEGYHLIARLENIPAIVLYGVAIQESQKQFGHLALPYPWTLNIEGMGMRYPSYEAAVIALRDNVKRGINSVDCGLMQVNWRYHSAKLRNYYTALDPFPNMQAGAQLLREQYTQCGNWFVAIGRYHNQRDRVRANNYATQVFQHISRVPGINQQQEFIRA